MTTTALLGLNNTVSLGFLDAGIAVGVTITNADDVSKLLGPSSSIGVSGGLLSSLAIDLISFEDVSNMHGDWDGFQIAIGKGIGYDIHIIETYTNDISNVIFEIKDKLEGIMCDGE